MQRKVKLGVNIDHVATLRNARGEFHPSLVRAAEIVKNCGGDSVTLHLREDRRHIKDRDVFDIKENVDIPINLEIAATEEMLNIALKLQPYSCCIVPEKREELTTEGGLNVVKQKEYLKDFSNKLKEKNIQTSLFIDPEFEQVEAAKFVGAEIIEFHTGGFCNLSGGEQDIEFDRIVKACEMASNLGIRCHAGHGLNYETTARIVSIKQIEELNIGHFIIGESVFEGMPAVISKMNNVITSNL